MSNKTRFDIQKEIWENNKMMYGCTNPEYIMKCEECSRLGDDCDGSDDYFEKLELDCPSR